MHKALPRDKTKVTFSFETLARRTELTYLTSEKLCTFAAGSTKIISSKLRSRSVSNGSRVLWSLRACRSLRLPCLRDKNGTKLH